MSKKTQYKVLSFFLAVLLLIGAVPFNMLTSVKAEENGLEHTIENFVEYDYQTVNVVLNGEKVNEVEITEYEKITLTAEGADEIASYQWQIERPDQQDVWVNIYDATDKGIDVSVALVGNMLKADNTASLRCVVESENGTYQSNVVNVTLVTEIEPVLFYSVDSNDDNEIMHIDDSDSVIPEFVTVTIKYEQWVNVYDENTKQFKLEKLEGDAFNPYIAKLKSETDLDTTVPNPTIVGFDAYLGDSVTPCDEVEINLTNIIKDVTYVVSYKPAQVEYDVEYYFQNIYDDLYVEDTSKEPAVKPKGYTGTNPDTSYTEAEFPGFTSLYYEPETIAADGSTVFHIYYERNYYLMEFDCNGGYGTDTVYVRYGTYVSVPNPVRAGWVFAGWDMTNARDEQGNDLDLRIVDGVMVPYEDTPSDGITPLPYNDNVSDALPATLPCFNSAYKALWTQANTTYNIAYWISGVDNEGNSTRTYIGSRKANALSGTKVSGPNDIATAYVCGEEHAHSNSCRSDVRNYLDFDSANTEVNKIVEGDGSTVVNVYYTYRNYTLRFYYAKSEDGNYYICGNTTEFANGTKNNIANQFYQVRNNWGRIGELPTMSTPDGMDLANYTTGSETIRVNNRQGTYYYLEFTRPYNSDISDLWPVGIFGSADLNPKLQYGDKAYFSAWNADSESWHDANNGNKTLKGNYQRLDYKLLMNNDPNDTTINYLAFWENATDTVKWNKPHKWIYKVCVPVLEGEEHDIVDHRGIKYKIYGTYEVYDNNTIDNHDAANFSQTPTALEGFTYLDCTAVRDGYHDGKWEQSIIYFYYTRNSGHLTFENHGETVDSMTQNNVRFDTNLSNFDHSSPSYPSTLEPNAYVFDGWYTTPLHFEGTKMEEEDWATKKMPDSNLVLYAYWKPIVRNVFFYYDYADYQEAKKVNFTDSDLFWYHTDSNGNRVPDSYPILTQHGSLVGTTYSNIPEAAEGYNFVGWFYMDKDNKKRFAPDSMEVKQDLHLFAEWSSGIDTIYSVSYKLEKDITIGENYYSAGTAIADVTTGHLTAGRTKTFTAKAGKQLYEDFQNISLFPSVNSHSILMDQNSDNTFTFTYVHDDSVWYRIRYVNKITGVDLIDPVVETSTAAIITPKFVAIPGYLPENYYIRKVLAADGNGTEEDITKYGNEIVFYYIPNTEHGLYSVEYYTESFGNTGEYVAHGKSWDLEQSLIGSADLNTVIKEKVVADKFEGFEISYISVKTYDSSGNPKETIYDKAEIANLENNEISGKVTLHGLEIKLYYERKSYGYEVQFVEYGTSKILGYGHLNPDGTIKSNTDETNVFTSKDTSVKFLYEDTINYTAPDVINAVEDGYAIKYLFYSTDEKKQSQSTTIEYGDSNLMTFYYKAKETAINYVPICFITGAYDFGGLSLNYESAVTVKNISGSNAIPGNGYRFVGWYLDAECKDPVNVGWRYNPGVKPNPDVQDNNGTKLKPAALSGQDEDTYYALFEPIKGNLTIKKEVYKDVEKVNPADTENFLFNVKGQGKLAYVDTTIVISGKDFVNGSASVTLTEVPIGDYVITEITDWSWKYGLFESDKSIDTKVAEGGTSSVTFKNRIKNVDWLGGESLVNGNKFAGTYTPY